VLGHSPIPLTDAYTNQGKWNGRTYADMTYFTDPSSKAGVIDTGTVNWIYALSECAAATGTCPAASVATITGDILRVFGQGPSGSIQPSVPNWKSVSPAGS
jgi:hypothetical protein